MYNRLTSFVFFSRVDTMNRIYWILSLEYAIFVHLPILAVDSALKVNKFDPIELIKNNIKKITR